MNDETGSLSRTCAQNKIAESGDYKGAEITEVTGIAQINENLKQVEFKWRVKPTNENPNPQSVDSEVTFRKYDDGWRITEQQ